MEMKKKKNVKTSLLGVTITSYYIIYFFFYIYYF